ncbi:nitroreductase family protein [Colwellia sp. MEBiC06753]
MTTASSSVIEFLQQRQSNPNLTVPAPNQQELETILQAAMSVPDHGGLTPWQMIVVDQQASTKLANLYVEAAKVSHANETAIAKAERMPSRAPLMVIVATNYQSHPKVPKQEQLVTAGCAAHTMQMAAVALGYSAMWRTGDMAYADNVKAGLGIESENDIVGYLYIGSEAKTLQKKQRKSFKEVTRYL